MVSLQTEKKKNRCLMLEKKAKNPIIFGITGKGMEGVPRFLRAEALEKKKAGCKRREESYRERSIFKESHGRQSWMTALSPSISN